MSQQPYEGGGGGPHVHGVDPSDPEHHATPGALTDQAGLEGSVAPNEIRNPIVPPDAKPGD